MSWAPVLKQQLKDAVLAELRGENPSTPAFARKVYALLLSRAQQLTGAEYTPQDRAGLFAGGWIYEVFALILDELIDPAEDGTYVIGDTIYGPKYGPRGPTEFLVTVWNQSPTGFCYEEDAYEVDLYAKWASRGINCIKQQHPDFVSQNAQAVIDAAEAAGLMMIAAPRWSSIFGDRVEPELLDFRAVAVNDPYWRVNWLGYTLLDEPEIYATTYAEHLASYESFTLAGETKPAFWNFTALPALGPFPDGNGEEIKWKRTFEYSDNNSHDTYSWHQSRFTTNASVVTRELAEIYVSTWNTFGPVNDSLDISLRQVNLGLGGRRFTSSKVGMVVHLHYNAGPISPPRAVLSDPIEAPVLLDYSPGDKPVGHYIATGRITPLSTFYPKGGSWQPGRFLRDDCWTGIVHGSSNLLIFPQSVGGARITGYLNSTTNRLTVTVPIEQPTAAHLSLITGGMGVVREAGPYFVGGYIAKEAFQESGTPGREGVYILDPSVLASDGDIGSIGTPETMFLFHAAGPGGDDSNAENLSELAAAIANINRMQAHPTGGNLLINPDVGGRRPFTALRCPDIDGDVSLYKEDMTAAPIQEGYTEAGVPIPDDGGYVPLWEFGWPVGFEGFHVTGDDGAVYIYVKSMSNGDAPTWFSGFAPLGLPARAFGAFELVGFRRVGSGAAVEMTGTSGVIKAGVDDGAATFFYIESVAITKNEGNSGLTNYKVDVRRGGNLFGLDDVTITVSGTGLNPANAADFEGGVFPSATLNFDAAEATVEFSFNVNGDTTAEFDETFAVTLSAPSAGTVLVASGKDTITCTITNDDAPLASSFVWLVDTLTSAPTLSGAPAGAVHLRGSETTNVTRGGVTMRADGGAGNAYDDGAGFFAGVPCWSINNATFHGLRFTLPAGDWEVGFIATSPGFGGFPAGTITMTDDPDGAANLEQTCVLASDASLMLRDTDGTAYTNSVTAIAGAVNNLTFLPVTITDLGSGTGELRITCSTGLVHLAAVAVREA